MEQERDIPGRFEDGRLTWEEAMCEVMVHEVGSRYANLDDGQFIYI